MQFLDDGTVLRLKHIYQFARFQFLEDVHEYFLKPIRSPPANA